MNVVLSGTPGPEPMTVKSLPTTSEIASVRHRDREARASCPPLTAEMCFRTVFKATMSALACISRDVVAIFAASVMPSAGTAISAEAPPDNRQRKVSSGAVAAANASAARPAASLSLVGNGCDPFMVRNGAGTTGRPGLITRPSTIRQPHAFAAAIAIAAAAFPTLNTRA